MSAEHIRSSIQTAINYYAGHLDEACSTDVAATAVVEEGLRCRATHPKSGATLISDMPASFGGGGTAPSPGWLLRAALANCDATMIAVRAAQLGVMLSTLEVTVDGVSDDRGVLGMDDSIPAGPLSVRIRVRIGAHSGSPEKLSEIVEWAEKHSPVGDAVRRGVPTTMEIEFV